MKIKNKFIIPVIAVLVALIMVGSPATIVAADTEASDSTTETTTTIPAWTHDYTYKTTTQAPTSSLEEEIEGAVSDILGDVDENLGDTIRDAANTSGGILRGFRNIINKIIEIFKKIGDFLGGNFTLGGILGSLTSTDEQTQTTATTVAQ